MTILRKCPVCLSTVNSDDSIRCAECGAVLDHENSAADSIAVDDIIKKVKQQITPLDDNAHVQPPGAGSFDGRDISEILSDDAFQAILHESRGKDEVSSVEDAEAFPEVPAGEERFAPFGKVPGSFKQPPSSCEMEIDQRDVPVNSSADGGLNSAKTDKDRPVMERPDPVRPPSYKKRVPKSRTWWGITRQTLWLLGVLLVCIVFFRIVGPEKKETTIEDFFRPGNPDVKFLDAIEFFEKYYERHPEKRAGNVGTQTDEVFAGSMQPSPPVDRTDAEPTGQAPDNSTSRDPFSPASRGVTP